MREAVLAEYCLGGQMGKASILRAGDSGIAPRFSQSNHTD